MSENLCAMDFPDLRCKWETAARRAVRRAMPLLTIVLMLGGCAFGSADYDGVTYTADRGVSDQPFPKNYRPQLLAFLHTYLNDPTDVRSAAIAEPMQREVGGRQRYVTCLRYSAKNLEGSYTPVKERAVVYIDGRLDRLIEKPGEICAGANYAPFPELEKLTR
ncbi:MULTISPECIES: hypothetical protein [Afipia]|jgi:hypothetical protein|nr:MULTISPECIES: hypothetical protein [Afipia]MBE0704785.1 hypothetical protein [Afipia sp.]RTL76840.1 MAG: hypothetical protein EKK36_03510 [Bradyrhizobiaceae bacterium]